MKGSVTGRFSISDGVSITWYEPPPVETITSPSDIRTVNRNLTKGFEAQLSWNFSLSAGLTLATVKVELQSSNTAVASYVHQFKSVSVANGFQDRFNVTWIPSKLTLTVFNVATNDEDVFDCNVDVFDGVSLSTWRRRIQAKVVGKLANIRQCMIFFTVLIKLINRPHLYMQYLKCELSKEVENISTCTS